MSSADSFAPFDVIVRPVRGHKIEVQVLNAGVSERPVSNLNLPSTFSVATTGPASIAVGLSRDLLFAHAPLGAEAARDSARALIASEEIGSKLYAALFNGGVARLLEAELERVMMPSPAPADRPRLRMRLFFDSRLADVAALPWELAYHPGRREFLGRSPRIALSRCLPAERSVPTVPLRPPLKVVIVGPQPRRLKHLDLARERELLRRGLEAYPSVEVREARPATLERLVEVLDADPEIHILHFMGHGTFDSNAGALAFETSRGGQHLVPGKVLAEHLPPSVRLVVLNSCRSGEVARRRGFDPMAGVATSLLLAGLPAVVAMQVEVSDRAAIAFSGKLYSALASGDPVDVAAGRGRLAIFRQDPQSLEWAVPVLYLQVADGQILVPAEAPPRQLIIGLSLVGEAEPEAAAVERVVADLRPRIERLGISVTVRSLPADAATGDEAGPCDERTWLWPGRSRTSTTTAARIGEALARSIQTLGHGLGVVFHSASADLLDLPAGTPLAELRWRHPELFCRFESAHDLAAQYRRHLLGKLFAERFEPAAVRKATAQGDPAQGDPALAKLVDDANAGPGYLDRSSRRVRDRLERIARLFDLHAALSASEAEVLRCAAHVRALDGNGAAQEQAIRSAAQLGWDAAFTAAVGNSAAAGDDGVDLADPALRTGPWRLDLIAALLRLSEILDLDRRAVRLDLAGSMPASEIELAEWVAFFTREVRISPGSIVQFALEAPAPEWIEPLKRLTSLRLEVAWQEKRAVLLQAGLTMAVAPSEVLLTATLRPPAGVFERLGREAKRVHAKLADLEHLGEPPHPLSLEALLPLPGSAVDGEETVALPGQGPPWLLEVADEQTGEVLVRRSISGSEREVVLDVGDWRPDRWYSWSLYSEAIKGEWMLVRLGRLRPLAAPQRRLWQLSAPDAPGERGPVETLLSLGLHNQVLRQLAPLLRSGRATLEEAALAQHLIVGAYDWVLHAAPDCPLVEVYRNAALSTAGSHGLLQGG